MYTRIRTFTAELGGIPWLILYSPVSKPSSSPSGSLYRQNPAWGKKKNRHFMQSISNQTIKIPLWCQSGSEIFINKTISSSENLIVTHLKFPNKPLSTRTLFFICLTTKQFKCLDPVIKWAKLCLQLLVIYLQGA